MAMLSDVTHVRLDQRRIWEDEETTSTKGIRNLGGFDGCIRCVEVVRSPEDYFLGTNVWAAEQTGEITVRRGGTGQPLLAIERKKDVFVVSMLSYGGFMWCGLSDGYLRVFDELTYELAFEVKQHAGAITCMVALGGHIFTGSRDWQILQWDAATFRYMVQLSGHQNTVNCLAASGNTLYSGGSDYAIRCWDLETMQEKAHPWPIIGHRGDVKALVIEEVYLFSASTDGTMKAWNTQTGQLVKFMDHRDGPITTLMRDPTAARIWAGGVDGIICVWDAQSLQLVTRMFDHAGTYVNCLQVLARVNTLKVWSVASNGIVKVWMSDAAESDAQHQIAALRQEQELQQTVDHMRAAIIQNYEELERRKEQLRRIEMIDERRRMQLALALGGKSKHVLERLFYSMTIRWIDQRRSLSHRKRCAHMMLTSTAVGLMRLYYKRLEWYSQAKIERRRKRIIAESIMATTEKGLKVVYWHKLQSYANHVMKMRRKQSLAECLAWSSWRNAAHVYYQKMVRWLRMRRAHNRRITLAHSMLRTTDRGTCKLFFDKLEQHMVRKQWRRRQEVAAEVLLSHTNRGRLLIYWRMWDRFLEQQQDIGKKEAISECLENASGRALAGLYFRRLADWAADAESRMLERELQALRDENDALHRILSQPDMSEEELLAAVAEADEQIRSIEEETAAFNDQTYELDRQMEDVRRDINNLRLRQYGTSLISDDEMEMACEIIGLLKGLSVHCDFDFERLTISRQEGKGQEQLLYDKGIRTIKRAIEKENLKKGVTKAETFPPTGEWRLAHFESGRILPKRALFNACCGIREMVIAFDMMSFQMRSRMSHNREVVTNACAMIEMVLQCNKLRRLGEGDESEVKIKRRKRSSRKGASSGKASSSRKKKSSGKKKKKKAGSGGPPSRAATISPDAMGSRMGSRMIMASKGSRTSKASKASRASSRGTATSKGSSRKSKKSSKKGSSGKRRVPALTGLGSGRAPSPRPNIPRPLPRGLSPRPGAARGVSPRAGSKSGGQTPRAFRAMMTPRALHGQQPRSVSPRPLRKKPAAKRGASPPAARAGSRTPRASRGASPAPRGRSPRAPRGASQGLTPRGASPRPRVSRRSASPKKKASSRKKGLPRKRSTSAGRKSPRRRRSTSGGDGKDGSRKRSVSGKRKRRSVSPRGSGKRSVSRGSGKRSASRGSRKRSVSGGKRSASGKRVSGKAGRGKSPSLSRRARGLTPRGGVRKRRDPAKTPWLGMNIDVATRNEQECRISEVSAGGPAEYSGVEAEDVLISFGGDPITHVPSFQDAFARHAKVGSVVAFEVRRYDGSTHAGTVNVLSQKDKMDLMTM